VARELDDARQTLMPWGAEAAVDRSAVEAALAGVPAGAATATPARAAAALGCCERTVRNMVESGTLLARRVGAAAESDRTHWRVIVRADRPFDPARKSLLSLEEACKVFTNIGG
jgi:hypothetical protein